MAELVDALVSGTSDLTVVEVRVFFRATSFVFNSLHCRELFFYISKIVHKSVTKNPVYRLLDLILYLTHEK